MLGIIISTCEIDLRLFTRVCLTKKRKRKKIGDVAGRYDRENGRTKEAHICRFSGGDAHGNRNLSKALVY